MNPSDRAVGAIIAAPPVSFLWLEITGRCGLACRVQIDPNGTCRLSRGTWHAAIGSQESQRAGQIGAVSSAG
jgi:hypothetical protein